jgi:hypothetical protein
MKGFLKMKSKLINFTAVLFACGALAQDANQMSYINLLPPSNSTNATVTGTGVDVTGYKGNATFVVQTGTASATNNLLTVTLQTSAAISSGYVTITNVSATAGVLTQFAGVSGVASSVNVQTFPCSLARCLKYVRVVYTQSLADNSVPVNVVLVAPMKKN